MNPDDVRIIEQLRKDAGAEWDEELEQLARLAAEKGFLREAMEAARRKWMWADVPVGRPQ